MKNFTIFRAPGTILFLTALAFISFFAGCDNIPNCPGEEFDTNASAKVSWMADAKWGISHHQWIPRYGILDFETWEQYTNGFNVEAYADLVEKLGAGWVLIAVAQELGFINTTSDIFDNNAPPCPASNPGCINQPGTNRADYTPTRDLILDIAKALHRKGIRTLVYLPSHTPLQWGESPISRLKLRYDAHYPEWRSEMIAEKSQEWRTYVSGWLFDGYWLEFLGNADRSNNFLVTRRMYNAAVSGNANAVITFNPGDGYPTLTVDPFSTFTTGEYRDLPPIPPSGKIPGCGHNMPNPNLVQSHAWTFLSNNPDGVYSGWGRIQYRLKYSNSAVANRTKAIADVGGAVTWDVALNPSGEWRIGDIVQVQTIGNRAGTTTDTTYSSLEIVNNDHSNIKYSNTDGRGDGWTHLRDRGTGEYQQDAHRTRKNGAFFTYRFIGSSIVFATLKTSDQAADVEVYIDDVSQGVYSTYADHPQVQTIIFEKHDLSAGAHTLKIVKRSGVAMLVDVVLSKR